MTAHVAIIGAGGLGGPVAYALSAAGCALTICDHDVVELSNLQRQVQFRTRDTGRRKVDALTDELIRRGHERGRLRVFAERFTATSASAILPRDVDLIVDGSDNFETKFAVNDQAMARGLPFVIGSALGYSGQILGMVPGAGGRGCYRCLFEEPPPGRDAEGASCAEAGVLGAVVAVIGGLMARVALALARGRMQPGEGVAGSGLWVFDDLRALASPRWVREVSFLSRSGCPACASLPRRGRSD